MKTVTALAAASVVLATVSHATQIADEPRMLAESFLSPGEKTYVVGLRTSTGQSSFCGGVLITKKHVLSTPGCSNWSQVATVGENTGDSITTGESFRIVKKTPHPKGYNYVIFELEGESKFAPVPLANRAASAYAGKQAASFGWNVSSYKPPAKNVLIRNTNKINTEAECKVATIFENLDETLFCAGGGASAPQCRGYIGGPIVIEREGKSDLVLGSIVNPEGCGQMNVAGAAGVYTDAFFVKAWIQENAPGVKFE